ncbi:glycosyltransferase 87 family protein [Nocardia sp. NPDC059240]|uniref:glycosyltransferase 87 family protein n=1 Tax=Nocardia sp. NPDC059240 TaxID=3346786 RepID=UPI0036B5C8FA
MPLPVIDEAAAANGDASQRRSIPLVVVWLVVVVGTLAGLQWLGQAVMNPRAMLHLEDLDAYRIAADRVLHGIPVYDTPLHPQARTGWDFVYTPFAALLFVPLTLMHGTVFTWFGGLANFAMLTGSVWAPLSILGYRGDRRMLIVSPTAAGLLLLCEPIRSTMAFGQINILLLLLILADTALPDSARGKGIATGIAAGIKLTPAFFILYLLVTRRYRAAATAAGALLATMAIGSAMLPRDSLTFWGGTFADSSRIGAPETFYNESLRGLLARTFGWDSDRQLLWAAAVLAITVACLYLARRLSESGRELPAVVLCGLTGTVVSPFSWVHHWVWLAPLLIYLAHLVNRHRSLVAAVALLVVFVLCSGGLLLLLGVPSEGLLDLRNRGVTALIVHNAYVWLTLAALAVSAARIRARPSPHRSAPPTAPDPRPAGRDAR